MSRKPSVTTVTDWTLVRENETARIEVGTAVFEDDYWKVTPNTGKPTYFYGETAWMDAERYASDLEFAELRKKL